MKSTRWFVPVAVSVAFVVLAAACSGGRTTVLTDGDAGAETGLASDSGGSLDLSVIAADTSTTGVSTTTTSSTTTSTTTTVAPTTTAGPRRWTLMAGGDVLMDRSEPAGVNPFAGMVPSLASADIAVVNVEMAITERGVPVNKTFVFRAPPSAADTIADNGVDVVSLANNHARDYGDVGLLDTLDELDQRGIVSVGAGATDTDAYAHRIFVVDGGPRVAFVAATQVVPSGFSATSTRPGVANGTGQRERVLANVRVAAEDAEVVVALIHWGIERDTCPSGTQRSFAQDLLDAGATAVIGHHPHVLQPVVTTDDQLVAYSLGNFIWHARTGITGDTGILQLDFEDSDLVGWSFHPHQLDANGAPVPISEGSRHQRIVDIISGDCAKHDPPPVTTAPRNTVPETTAAPTTTAPTTTTPNAATTTVPQGTTTVPTTAPPTTAPPTTGPPTTGPPTTAASTSSPPTTA